MGGVDRGQGWAARTHLAIIKGGEIREGTGEGEKGVPEDVFIDRNTLSV